MPEPNRVTPQRRAVLDVLTESHDHPTAAEVHQRVRGRLPGIGAATVYRTLGLLVDSGAALELAFGAPSTAARYDANTGRHDHLVCTRCGRAEDVEAGLPQRLVRALAERTGYQITGYDLQLRGRCRDCQPRSG